MSCDEERDLACPVQHNHSLLRRGRALGTSFGSACPSSFTVTAKSASFSDSPFGSQLLGTVE